MQYRPDAAELADVIADLLEREVLHAVPAHLQHHVRVAANLCRIIEREARLGPAAADAERRRLAAVLGDHDADLPSLRATLAARLDDDAPLPPEHEAAIHDALLATLRDDLAISKPGYDAWDAGA